MHLKVFFFLFVVGATSAQSLFHLSDVEKPQKSGPPSLDQNPDHLCAPYRDMLSKIILRFLEKIRAHMDTGLPNMGIPPLDPLHIQNTSFHESKPYQYKVDGTIDNTLVEGLKSFNVTQISTSFLHLQANITVRIPTFFVTGRYNLSGKLLSVVPVKGAGPYLLTPSNLVTSVTSTLKLEHKYLQVTSMNFDLDMSNLFVKFEGLYGGGHVGSFLNQVMNRWGMAVFHRVESRIHDRLRITLISIINEKLKEIPLSELIGIFEGKPDCKRALSNNLIEKMENDPVHF